MSTRIILYFFAKCARWNIYFRKMCMCMYVFSCIDEPIPQCTYIYTHIQTQTHIYTYILSIWLCECVRLFVNAYLRTNCQPDTICVQVFALLSYSWSVGVIQLYYCCSCSCCCCRMSFHAVGWHLLKTIFTQHAHQKGRTMLLTRTHVGEKTNVVGNALKYMSVCVHTHPHMYGLELLGKQEAPPFWPYKSQLWSTTTITTTQCQQQIFQRFFPASCWFSCVWQLVLTKIYKNSKNF